MSSESEYDTATSAEVPTITVLEALTNSVKLLSVKELFKLLKVVTMEAEKKSRTSKAKDVHPKEKKQGSMPKGTIPHQLIKPRAWVEFTLKDAQENGWEAFTVRQTRKDKVTGVKFIEEVSMPSSVVHEGSHVFKDSVTESNPKGKQMVHKDAMSLSKQRKEMGHKSYAVFEAQYDVPTEPVSAEVVPAVAVVKPEPTQEKEKEPETKPKKRVVKNAATAAATT